MSDDETIHPAQHADNTEKTAETAGGDGAAKSDAAMPAQVEAVMAQYPRVARLCAGIAGGAGPDGQPLGTAESYDYAFTVALVKYFVRDPEILSTALKRRAGGHAADKGDEYIAGVIVRALNTVLPRTADAPTETPTIRFNLEKVTRFGGDPRVYTLTIGGTEVRLTSQQLSDREAFKQKYFDRLNQFPALPTGRGAPAEWEAIVQQIADMAEDITPPADGTREGALMIAIRRAIEDLPIGDGPEDLRRCGILVRHQRRLVFLFATDAIVAVLAQHDSKPEREEIARLLPRLGCEKHEHSIKRGGKRVESVPVWRVKPTRSQRATVRTARSSGSTGHGPSFDKPADAARDNPDTPDASDDPDDHGDPDHPDDPDNEEVIH